MTRWTKQHDTRDDTHTRLFDCLEGRTLMSGVGMVETIDHAASPTTSDYSAVVQTMDDLATQANDDGESAVAQTRLKIFICPSDPVAMGDGSVRFIRDSISPPIDGADSEVEMKLAEVDESGESVGQDGEDLLLVNNGDGSDAASVPFHRVINNTVYGGSTPTGDGSAPVFLNTVNHATIQYAGGLVDV